MKHAFLNHNKAVPVVSPGTATTSAIDSDWVGLAHGAGVVFTVIVNEGRASTADDNTVTLRQATSAAGDDAKTLIPRRAYVRASGTNLAAAAAATPSVIEAENGAIDIHVDGDMTSIIEIEIDASELDVNSDFTHVQARLASVGSSTTTVGITAIVTDLHHVMDPTELPNVLA